MPVKTFQEIYDSLSAEQKTLLDNTFKAAPELKEGWLRQDDYSRNSAALAAEKAKLAEDLDYAERMRVWADVNVPKVQHLQEVGILDAEGNELWTAQKTQFEKDLAAARAAGGDMDEATLRKNVEAITKEYGVLKPEELKALIAEEARKLAVTTFDDQWKTKETNFNEKTIPFVAGFSSAVAVVASKYERESGKPWTADTAKEFFKTMETEKNFDPYAVSDKFMEPIKKAKEVDAENQKKIDDGIAAGLKARGVRVENGDTFIPQPEQKGNIALMLERSKAEGDNFESTIMAQAVAAAKELQAEGK